MAVQPTTEISLPFRIDSNGSIAQINDDQSRIAQHLVMIIGTILGERVMLPDYGSTVRLQVFEPNDPVTQSIISSQLEVALKQWEPAVTIKSVTPQSDPANPAMMTIQVAYTIAPSNTVYTTTVQAGGGLTNVLSF